MYTTRAVTAVAAAVLSTAALTGAAAGPAAGAAGPAAAACAPTWKLVSTPAPPGAYTGLYAAAATSANDAWFTGYEPPDVGAGDVVATALPWVLHWNGRSLDTAPAVPQPASFAPRSATAESFDSPADGWLLGQSTNLAGGGIYTDTPVPYAARWNSGRWTITPLAISPDPASSAATPNPSAVASLSPSDAWIVGGFGPEGPQGQTNGAMIEHWDGSSWSIVPNPASSDAYSVLTSITAVSATDIWAVGLRNANGEHGQRPLAEHWDGTAWSVVPVPAGNPAQSKFISVSADGPDDVWAVGSHLEPGTSDLATALVEHWDGTAWTAVTGLPDLGNSLVQAVYAASPSDVWAVAETVAPQGAGFPYLFEFLHWDGSSWTTVPLPGPHEYGLQYVAWGLAGSGPDDIWADGFVSDSISIYGTYEPMIAHLSCGTGRR
jgi:hypothetical protein